MQRSIKALLSLTTLTLTLAAAAPATANDWIDTRITFTIGDDNFLNDAGEQVPDSPTIGIGDRDGFELPFDNLDLASTGRENELHLVLYKRMEGIIPGLITEAAAALQLNMEALVKDDPLGKVLQDDSSYIRLAYALDELRRGKEYIDIVLFPLNGDRFRVGYLYDLTWGGTDMFPKKKGPTPAFKIGGNHGMIYWWAGMKMVMGPKPPREQGNEQGTKSTKTEHEALYSGLAGLGVQPVDGLSIDVGGGYVQQGWVPRSEFSGVRVEASGFSARVAYGRGIDVGLSSDLKLLRNDPEYLESFGSKPTYKNDDTFNWRVSAEGNLIAQTLLEPDLSGSTRIQWASAAALDFRLQRNYLRMNVTAVYRSLEFNLINGPSFPSYEAFSEDAIIQPQIFAALSADYHVPSLWLTPGIQAGVELPPAIKTELYNKVAGSSPSSTLIGTHSILMLNNGDRVILPEGEDRVPVYSVRVTARWFPSDMLTMMAFILFQYDQNATVVAFDAEQTKDRIFDEPVKFGAGITAQARF